MAAKKMYINGVEINAKLIPDLTALTSVEVTDTTKKSIPVADEDSPNDEAKKMLLSELQKLITGATGVKRYKALLLQYGNETPTAIVLENTLGVNPVFSREDVGYYYLTVTGNIFVRAKTYYEFIMDYDLDWESENIFSFGTGEEAGTLYNLNYYPILIEVYP
jgi:hypothetical protein